MPHSVAHVPPSALSAGRIFRFWLPLAATWLMMAVEGPFLAALIARLPQPEYNLAAFGVSLSLALLLEAPVVMLMAAGTALIGDAAALRRLQRFTYALNSLLTVVTLVALLPPVYQRLTTDLIGLPAPVATRTYGALWLLLPWPAAIGYRRLYQGVLIRHGLTRRVGYSTAIRMLAMTLTALAGYHYSLQGATVAAAALSAGVLAEAVACRWLVAAALRRLRATPPQAGTEPLSYRSIVAFYFPLALSSILILGVHPMISFFLARAPAPVESLAVFPVVRSLVFLFACLGLSYQEVGIALLGEQQEGYAPLRRFAIALSIATGCALGIIAFSPLADVWYLQVSGLTAELARYAHPATRILFPLPALAVWLSFQRSLYVTARRTRPVTLATVCDLAVIASVLTVATGPLHTVGIIAAALALVAGRCVSNLCLWLPRRHVDTPAPGRV